MRPIATLNESEKLEICSHYYETVNDNIQQFLKEKINKQVINPEKIHEDFSSFWSLIGAAGNRINASKKFDLFHNKS